MKKRILAFTLSFVLILSCFPATAFAVDMSLPSLWEEYEDYFMVGTFGAWKNGDQAQAPTEMDQRLYHYRGSSFGNELKLDSQIGGDNSWWVPGYVPPSRAAYQEEVERIQKDTTLTEEEKAAAIQKADCTVTLVERPNSMNYLDAIQEYNKTLPDREKRQIRGHVLVWHGGQQPMHFFKEGFDPNGEWASREVMLQRLDSYIQQMFEKYSQYKDVIYSWDVVNEGLDDYTGQVRNMDDAQSGQWGGIFRRPDLDNDPDARLYAESEYIRKAFEYARKWSAYYDCDWTLYYNDFQDSNKPYEPKMSQTVKMLRPIYEAGNIDGYGMQARLSSVFPSPELLRKQIDMGLTVADEFCFTEADIRSDFQLNPDYDPSKPSTPSGDTHETNTYDVNNAVAIRKEGWERLNENGWTSTSANTMAMEESIQKEQADYAADLMDILIEYKDKFAVLQWDGINDSSTFNGNKGAHMWSGLPGNAEKMSYFAIIGAPNRDKMKQTIASGPAADQQSQYTEESWNAYQKAKSAAEDLVDVRIYDMEGVNAVKTATSDLLTSIEKLEKTGGTIEVESIALEGPSLIKRNQTAQLTAVIAPEDAAVQDVTWESLTPGVATVDENGLITAKKAGFAIIKATANNGVSRQISIRITA